VGAKPVAGVARGIVTEYDILKMYKLKLTQKNCYILAILMAHYYTLFCVL
jgi:hypothetical protein